MVKWGPKWAIGGLLKASGQPSCLAHLVRPLGQPGTPWRVAGQCWLGQTPKKKKNHFPLLEFKDVSEKYFRSSYSRSIQLGKIQSWSMNSLHMQIRGQQNSKSRSLSNTSHCTQDIKKRRGSCWYRILSNLDLCARPWKIQKYYFLSMGPWEHLEWHGVTCSDIGAPKVFFSAKMTKMPLDNPRFDWRSNDVKTTFFIVLHQTLAFLEIFNNLTKFDPKFISSGPKNPNFNSAVRMSWNQCHCEYYQILIPMTIHGSKLELKRPRYH